MSESGAADRESPLHQTETQPGIAAGESPEGWDPEERLRRYDGLRFWCGRITVGLGVPGLILQAGAAAAYGVLFGGRHAVALWMLPLSYAFGLVFVYWMAVMMTLTAAQRPLREQMRSLLPGPLKFLPDCFPRWYWKVNDWTYPVVPWLFLALMGPMNFLVGAVLLWAVLTGGLD